jgi:hypothetical protein
MTDRAAELELLRAVLWESIQTVSADKVAPLANQYRATLAELAELTKGSGKVGDPVDEITARRAARRAGTA